MKIRSVFVGLLVLGLALMLAVPASAMGGLPGKGRVAGAQGGEITLKASEIPVDQHASKIQWAVDNYSIVNLEGAFDFGDDNNVVITKDVEIRGSAGAKIKGGSAALSIGGDARQLYTPPTAHPKVTIKNITFENPYWGAIFFIGSTGGSVEDCHFTGGRLRDIPSEFPVPGAVPMCPYIYVGSFLFSFYPADISGNFSIKNNVMNGMVKVSDVPKPGYVKDPYYTGMWYTGASHGILLWLYSAEAVVSKNNVKNVPSTAIELLDYQKSLLVTKNVVDAGPVGWFNFGIFDAGFFTFPNSPSEPAYITQNSVKAKNITGIAICQGVSNVVAKENNITLDGAMAGMFVGVADNATDCLIHENKIDGTGPFAIMCDGGQEMGSDPSISTNNSFVENNFQDFSPFFADMFFGLLSQNNLFVGKADDVVVDLGTDNQVVTGNEIDKELSQEIKDQIEEAKQDMRDFREAMKQLRNL